MTSEGEEKPCYYDEKRDLWVHRFEPGQIVCICGEKVIRKPENRYRMKFGRQIKDSDFE